MTQQRIDGKDDEVLRDLMARYDVTAIVWRLGELDVERQQQQWEDEREARGAYVEEAES